jgi:signal recognition particle subunit SRP19
MKDYEHVVIWLDYFNKTLPRAKGRRLEKEKCVFDPSLKELTDAAQAAGFEITETEEKVRYPKRPYVRSGYIVLPKGSSKTIILNKIAQKLLLKRTKQSDRSL